MFHVKCEYVIPKQRNSADGASLFLRPRIRWPASSNSGTRFFVPARCDTSNSSDSSAKQNRVADDAAFDSLPFSNLPMLSQLPLGIDPEMGNKDTGDGTVFGSLPPRGRHTGCRPWPLGLLICAQPERRSAAGLALHARWRYSENCHHVSIPCHDAVRLPPVIPASFTTQNYYTAGFSRCSTRCTTDLYARS